MRTSLDKVGIFSRGLLRMPGLRELLGAERLVFRPSSADAARLAAVAGWGHKPTADTARAYAREHGVPYLALEDGFIRSIGVAASEPPASLIVDELGIYYDARSPSKLEQLLELDPEQQLLDQDLLARAASCRRRLVESGVSKYNHAPDELPQAITDHDGLIVVADQTYDDASVSGALADERSFDQALEAALDENSGARVVVKVHPATLAGKKRGYLSRANNDGRVLLLASNVTPQSLLRHAKRLYVVSSQLGFEALLAGVPVTCFGQAFYAGWGLTDDRQPNPRRTRRLTLDQLVAGVLLLYPRYRHPVRGGPCEVEQVIEHFALQRRIFAENRRRFVCLDRTYWKRPFLRRYLGAPGHRVRFVRSPRELTDVTNPKGLTAVAWATRKTPAFVDWTTAQGVPLWLMEDGFLRSSGLGSDLTAPGSLVLDQDGIYYDPSRPSRLEHILQTAEFSRDELERARTLRDLLLKSKVSKYNLPSGAPLRLTARAGQRIVLVPGQVADDASIRLGAPGVADNLQLVRAVRQALPDAYILYKPHPDVLSGNRAGHLRGIANPPWDLLVERTPIADCLAAVHEVHTMTSLVGFEALLRSLPVVVYGQPFYSGWGLTRDLLPLARRTRQLTLDELVAGALLRYPRYINWSAGCFCTAEDKIWELSSAKRTQRLPFRLPGLVLKAASLLASGREWWRGRESERG